MASRPTLLLDTGPLVAALNRRDRHHEWAKSILAARRPPAFTCEAVVSEACFLLRGTPGGADAVLALIESGLVQTTLRLTDEAARVRRLMSRHADVPMAFADACLVRLSEMFPDAPVATLDADFKIYRRNGRLAIPTLMPGSRR